MVGGGGGWQAVHQTLPRSHAKFVVVVKKRVLPGIGFAPINKRLIPPAIQLQVTSLTAAPKIRA